VILCIHVRFSGIPSIRTTVLFVRLQVTLEHGEVCTIIVTQTGRIWTNDLVCVDVILANDASAE